MPRVEGWEGKLNAALEGARHEPYRIGAHDCALWVAAVIADCTGVDYRPAFAGLYRSRRASLRLIARLGGGRGSGGKGLAGAVSAVLEREPVPVLRAMRGDPVLWPEPGGDEHLGICVGAHVAILGEQGLQFIRLERCVQAWNV